MANREGKEDIFKGAGECFSTILCLENLPQHIKKMRGREENRRWKEKRGRGEEEKMRGREENIFIGAGEGFQICYVLETFNKGKEEKWKGRGGGLSTENY